MESIPLKISFLCVVSVLSVQVLSEAANLGDTGLAEEIYDVTKAQDRKFTEIKRTKLAPLIEKKNWLFSLFTRSPDSHRSTVHALAPLEQYPIWKVHKYKGIELRPVQVIDVPATIDYSTAHAAAGTPITTYQQPTVDYAPPTVEPLRMPHLEYGPPVEEYAFQGDNKYQAQDDLSTSEPVKEADKIVSSEDNAYHVDVHPSLTPVVYQEILGNSNHASKFKHILGLLKSHKNIIAKLKSLKSWKHKVKQSPILMQTALPSHETPVNPVGFAVPTLSLAGFPEVEEIPVKGLEHLNIQVPELPPLNLAPFASALTTGPYLRIKYSNPLPVINYDYSSSQYALPNPQLYQPIQTYEEQAQAPYYGTPPLFDSYGTPLPPDAYSSAASDQILSFATPENVSQNTQVQSETTSKHPGSNTQQPNTKDDSVTKALNGSQQPIQLPVANLSTNAAKSPKEENSETG